MDEQSEIPQKERTVVSPELAERMDQATASIEGELKDPVAQVANATEQMSMFAEFGKLAKDSAMRRLGVMFKDAKAGLGILPFVNKVSEAITPASGATVTLGKTIGGALQAENEMVNAEKTYESAKGASAKAEKKFVNPKLQEGTKQFNKLEFEGGKKLGELSVAEFAWKEKQALAEKTRLTATDQILNTPRNTKEKWSSRQARKLTGIKTDSDYAIRYDAARARATEINTDRLAQATKKGISAEKVKLLTDIDVMRWTGNGDMPARTWWGEGAKGAKTLGVRMIFENLGPIINPVPDVPGLVTLASYGVEAFGGQWWAGLIPPVWQYLHNRYEDVAIGLDTSKKAMDIVKRHWSAKMNTLEDARIAKAAGVFLPKKEFAQSV